ncbi:MAG: phenylalanine--tRNA ligase subunit alpha, partial [Thermodesulfobacteriota bacterium]|nr:phenylalanine--tRNA ligase subunit alpha [Thermodesulfobacteriota bacterium]
MIQKRFPDDQYKILHCLEGGGELSQEELADKLNIDLIFIAGAVQALSELGLIFLKEVKYKEYRLGKKGKYFEERELPERRIIKYLNLQNRPVTIKEVGEGICEETKVVGESLKILDKKAWAQKEKNLLILTETGKDALNKKLEDEKLMEVLCECEFLTAEEIRWRNIDLENALELLKGRRQIVEEKERIRRMCSLSDKGKKLLLEGIEKLSYITQLTPELLKDGKWKDFTFKKYNINLDTVKLIPGKFHPISKILESTRRIFLEMGFKEINSSLVESSFWDFDALFQPQDHPAREMQDTFFIEKPGSAVLPEEELVNKVKETHENGGNTGSLGWQYKWISEKAKQNVLRTHTTASTIRALAKSPEGTQKFFNVGLVFRRESIDYKHLPIFHQVDGIIIDKNASFAHLLGTLEVFYKKMGFNKFEFRPAFFPYTEPSVEIFVWLKEKKD